ncbi:MAG: WYL domain-containing protein [Proteobacteria bacterium]|nr:WYL domain-containing protein [Pseudomonadota bacterium]
MSNAKPKGKSTPRSDRAKRLLDLVMLLLRARSPVAFREIREQFTSYKTSNADAGLRAFERDKAELLDLGVPIRYVTPEEDEALEEGGYIVDLKSYRMPEVKLTPDEVSALVLAASVARAVPGGSYPKIVDLALQKLAFDVPKMHRQEMPDTPVDFPPQPSTANRPGPVLVHFPSHRSAHARELGDRFALLEGATRNRKRISIRYQNASTGLVRDRDVDPYGLVYRQGAWVVIGYCHLRNDVRSFRIDRILELKIAPRPKSPDFQRPDTFDVRAYASRSPWTFATAPAEDIEIEIRPDAADTANEDFGPHASRRRLEDGSTLISFCCSNLDYAVSRVLAAKGSILIRRGERLRRRIADELTAIREHYER